MGSEQGRETVLVVEDESGIRELLGEVLSKQGYRVLTAQNGREAYEIAQRQSGKIEMVLTDLVMPEVSGIELARNLKADQPDIKVLLMSGYSAGMIDQHGPIEPGTALLEKPFTPSGLLERVRELLAE